ncbi:hypothetical protein CEN47_28330, partial [Fischerella thermalis CCMEE 5319]
GIWGRCKMSDNSFFGEALVLALEWCKISIKSTCRLGTPLEVEYKFVGVGLYLEIWNYCDQFF